MTEEEREREAADRAGIAARYCLRGCRGALTDAQYIEALGRIQLAIEVALYRTSPPNTGVTSDSSSITPAEVERDRKTAARNEPGDL
jgi:hypothetical protein